MRNEPIHAVAVEQHTSRVTVGPKGELRGEADVTITEEDYRRIWSGYMCPFCYEPLETAFVRTCRSWCGGGNKLYSVDEWHSFMEGTLDGYKWIGPSRETIEKLEESLGTQ